MSFKRTQLSMVIFCAMYTNYALSNTAHLEVIDVTLHSGTKNATNVVTLKQIERNTQTDLRGLLSAEPSINFGGGVGGTSQWTTIRGMGQDQIDIKVDNTYSDSQLFHHEARFILDPSLIKKINVQKGAGSASSGIGATSGSIEAITKDAKDLLKENQQIGFKLNTGINSNKGYHQGASVYAKYGAFDTLVSGNWIYEKDYLGGKKYRNLSGEQRVQNSALNQRGLLFKVGADVNEDHRIVLSHRQEHYHGKRALREEFDFTNSYLTKSKNDPLAPGQALSDVVAGKDRKGGNTYYVLDEKGNYIVNGANNNPRYRITTQDTTNLEWSGKNLGFISEIKANIYHIHRNREEPMQNNRVRLETTGANINFDSVIGNNHMIKYGLNYRQQVGKPNKLAAKAHNQKKQDTGIYLEGIWGIGPVTLTTGARYDHFDFRASNGKKVSKGHFNPSLSLIWEIKQDFSLNTNLNYATRSPRLYEIMLAGNGNISITDDITAEKARNTEIGFNYNLNNELSLEGSYFWQRVKNAHSMRSIGNEQREIYNGALLRNKGYEISTSYKKAGFTTRLGVADSSPEVYGNTADNTVFAVKTGRTWTAGLSYHFDNPDLEIGWKGRFVESTTGSPSRNSGGNQTKVKQLGYSLHDLYASWKANDSLILNISIDNIFDKTYRSHSQRAGHNSLVGKGRDARFTASYTF